MNKRVGGGMHRTTTDKAIVQQVQEFKLRCGVDEDFRVEDLTKAQHLKLVADKLKVAHEEARSELETARTKHDLAFTAWINAHTTWLDANEEETK